MANINRGDKDVALQTTTAWGTPTEPSTLDRVPVTDITLPTGERDFYKNDMESGNENMADCIEMLNFLEQTLSMKIKARYDSNAVVRSFISVYGKHTYTTDTPVPGVEKHAFQWDPIIDDITPFLVTIAWDSKDEVEAVASAILKSFSMDYDKGFNLNTEFVGDRLINTTDDAEISGWAQPLNVTSFSACEGDLMKMSGVTVRMNDESGYALAAGDEIVVNNITISPVRNYEVPAQESGTNFPGMPFESDTPAEFTVTLELRAKNTVNQTWFSKYQAGTTQKLDITILGDIITGATPYTLYLAFPSMNFEEPPKYDFNSPIPVSVTLKMMKAQANPAGMTATVPYGYFYNLLDDTVLTGFPAI